MDENPPSYPGVSTETYQTLGKKTFMMFVLQRVQAALVLLVVAIILFAIHGQSFLLQTPIPNLSQYVDLAALAFSFLFVVFFLLAYLTAWLMYSNYKFCLGENSLKIKRGILNKEEVAIPYRQIQDVDINRDISFRMLGLSRIVILTAGHEDEPKKSESGESEGILPALDKDLAEWLQAELLKRANIQKVTEVKA